MSKPDSLQSYDVSNSIPHNLNILYSPFKASSCRPSCINRKPATSASRNVDGALGFDCSDLDDDDDEEEEADDECNLVIIGPLIGCCCCCVSILLLDVVPVKAFVHAMMRIVIAKDFIFFIYSHCSVDISMFFQSVSM